MCLFFLALVLVVATPSAIPVYVICFNRFHYITHMVAQLRPLTSSIRLIDNKSTQPSLLAYYESLRLDPIVSVMRMDANRGHAVFRTLFDSFPAVFALTDPDLRFRADVPLNMLEQLYQITEEFKIGKAGCALNISDSLKILPIRSRTGFMVRDWEKRMWSSPRSSRTGLECYHTGIDTTMAVVNKRWFTWQDKNAAIRVAGAFTALHMPWLERVDEDLEYMASKNKSSGWWLN